MNNVITNGKASISDWTNFHYEKKSISKERNITLYKKNKKVRQFKKSESYSRARSIY